MTFEEIVRTQRAHSHAEMMDFVNEPSLSAAIRGATLCKMKDGKRHAHCIYKVELMSDARDNLRRGSGCARARRRAADLSYLGLDS